MRTGITVDVTANDRQRLAAIVADRNSPQKHVWRANIVLLTADGCGTAEIMHRSGASKTDHGQPTTKPRLRTGTELPPTEAENADYVVVDDLS